jgi:hypothetical protein
MTLSAAERRKTPHVHLGIDLRTEMRLYCRTLGITIPECKFRHSDRTSGCSGRAWSYYWQTHKGKLVKSRAGSGRILLTIGRDVTAARVLLVLLHELTHIACPDKHHGEAFCAKLVKTARELWGVKLDGWCFVTPGIFTKRAYAIDHMITTELQALLNAGAVTPSAAQVTEPAEPVSLDSRRQELVRKREEHARKMLSKNERQLKAAQARVQKWRGKVRYYEKSAAKRGTP